MTFFPQKWQIS